MKKIYLILALAVLFASCNSKRADTFKFEGTIHGYLECSLATTSIMDLDFGYVVSLITPDSIGNDYTVDGKTYHNCVILYHTRARYYDCDTIRGTMYLDDKYSRAYCNYHIQTGLPEGVCYTLDR